MIILSGYLTGDQLVFFKAQTIASGSFIVFKMNEKDALEYFKKLCRSLLFDEMEAKTHSYAFYLRCQNRIFEQENLPTEFLYTLPPFNEFGRRNITQLLLAWEEGGETALEGKFREISKGLRLI
jgi:hypothetical protein